MIVIHIFKNHTCTTNTFFGLPATFLFELTLPTTLMIVSSSTPVTAGRNESRGS
jgi:hypothetical protein